MLRKLTFLLILIPLVFGAVADQGFCCELVDAETSQIIANGENFPTTNESSPHNCIECCETMQPKITVNSQVVSFVPGNKKVETVFAYSFSRISNHLPSPYKPPQT